MMLDRQFWSDLVGIPFKFHGRDKNGYDCLGLVIEVNRRRGIVIPDFVYPNDEIKCAQMFLAAQNNWRKVDIAPGTTLGFRRGNMPQHVGICIDEDRFIHASEDIGQVAISYLSRGYSRLCLGAFSYDA